MADPITLGALAVGVATLAFQGTSTAMQAYETKRKAKKSKVDAQQTTNGLVPHGSAQQHPSTEVVQYGGQPQPSSTNLAQYAPPAQHPSTASFQAQQDARPYNYLDNKVNILPEGWANSNTQYGWTTVQKTETIYFQYGTPFTQDCKIELVQPTQHYQTPPQSPPSSPLPSAQMMLQQQQPQHWPPVTVSSYVPGQGQLSGLWSPAAQPVGPPPPYQQTIKIQDRKRDRLRHWM